ncbi:MAG TPA: TRAP transporter substrate-binding protein DctP [Longimicrobiales bacterium]|nr:TRAP transporter substrate-binding protein DctP [Longimicrobiales bacterium]
MELESSTAAERESVSPSPGEPIPENASGTGAEPVSRRRFLGVAAGAAVGGVAVACTGAGESGGGAPGVVTRPNIQWRMASSYTRSLDALYGAVEVLSQTVANLTDGRFQIRAYPAGEIVPALQVLDAVEQGTVQVGQTASYYYTGKHAAFAFDTCLPFGLTSRQHHSWMAHGGGMELMRELFAEFGLVNFLACNTGAQMGGWFRREINSVADLRGLTMRIPGLGGEVMSRLGVRVQVLGGAELFPALERGAIDAAEWVGPYDDERLGLHQVAPYYYYPGWWEPCGAVSFIVNKRAWEQLPVEYQHAFEAAVATAGPYTQWVYDARNPEALDRLLQSGTRLRRFPDDVMRAAQEVSTEIAQSHAAADPRLYGRIYESWSRFRESAYRWFATAEYEYMRFAFPTISG